MTINDLLSNSSMSNELEESRIVSLIGPVETNMADAIMKQLMIFNKKNKNKPINLYINSPGGEVDSGFEIIDTMKMIEAPVYTVATGLCASMASLILSAGDKRAAFPHSRIMIHQVSAGYQGKAAEIESSANETLRRNKESLGFLAANCGKTYEELKKDCVADMWLTPEKALQYGVIDFIMGQGSEKTDER